MEFMQLCTVSPSDRLDSCSCSPHGAVRPGPATVRSAAMEMSRRQQRNRQALAGDGGVARR